MPANAGRSACATWPTVTPSEPARPALDLHVELRLLALRRQPDVDRAGHGLHRRRDLFGEPLQLGDVGPLQLHLDLLDAAGEAGRNRSGHAAQRRQLAPHLGFDHLLAALALRLRLQLDEDVAGVDRFALAADGGVGVEHFRLARAPIAAISCALIRVYCRFGPGRRLQRDR